MRRSLAVPLRGGWQLSNMGIQIGCFSTCKVPTQTVKSSPVMNTRSQKYAVNQYHIEVVLAWGLSAEIAIPEIQRPFVWDATKVRDLTGATPAMPGK